MAMLDIDELDKIFDGLQEDGVYMIYHSSHCKGTVNLNHYQHQYAKLCDVPDLSMLKTAAIYVGSEHITRLIADWFDAARASGKESWTCHELGDYIACQLLALK